MDGLKGVRLFVGRKEGKDWEGMEEAGMGESQEESDESWEFLHSAKVIS